MSLDPNKTYLVWNGTEFPNSTNATFKVPAGSTIDWGDGTVETFDTASTTVNTHTYTDGKTEHTIAISGLTSIGSNAFAYCSNLTSVTIGNSVTSIAASAFINCSSLTSVTIGNSVTSIGSYAFAICSSLKDVYITDIVAWCNISFQNYEANPLRYAHNLYLNNELVTELTIPDSVTIIKSFAFAYCSSLTSVTIGNSVTNIGNWAFEGCDSLTSVTIGNGVKSIYDKAFYNCSSLMQLVLFPETPPTLASNAIPANVQSIYVQQSSKAAYQAATNWTTFASKIVSDNIYLSFVRFNQKNKECIDKKLTSALSEFGGKLYKHMLNIKKSSGEFFVLTFLSPTSIAITNATLIDNDSNWILGATGFSSTGFACICVSLMPASGLVIFGNGNTIQILYSEVTDITDNLIEP